MKTITLYEDKHFVALIYLQNQESINEIMRFLESQRVLGRTIQIKEVLK